MRLDGEWLLCEDAVVRPVFRAEIAGANNVWRSMELLADTGADHTVISANVLETLGFSLPDAEHQIGEIGGVIGAFSIASRLRFMREDGTPVVFRGEFLACTEQSSLDMSVTGARHSRLVRSDRGSTARCPGNAWRPAHLCDHFFAIAQQLIV